jgi:hypothetical protein
MRTSAGQGGGGGGSANPDFFLTQYKPEGTETAPQRAPSSRLPMAPLCSHTDMSSCCLLQAPIRPQLPIRWSVFGVLSCCGRQEAESTSHGPGLVHRHEQLLPPPGTHMATTTDPVVGFRCSFVLWASGSGVKSQIREAKACHGRNMARRATASSKSKHSKQAASSERWSRDHHHGAGATGSCSMWTQARAPRPHRTCLCEISRGLRTATSRESTSHGPGLAHRHEQL